jgi:hypothetical protein
MSVIIRPNSLIIDLQSDQDWNVRLTLSPISQSTPPLSFPTLKQLADILTASALQLQTDAQSASLSLTPAKAMEITGEAQKKKPWWYLG